MLYQLSPFATTRPQRTVPIPVRDLEAFRRLFRDDKTEEDVAALSMYAEAIRNVPSTNSSLLLKILLAIYEDRSHLVYSSKHGSDGYRHITSGVCAFR